LRYDSGGIFPGREDTPGFPHHSTQRGISQQRNDGGGKTFRSPIYNEAGASGGDVGGDPDGGRRDYRHPTRHRFGGGHPEILLVGGEYENVRRGEGSPFLGPVDFTGQEDGRTQAFFCYHIPDF
jgi:hypothetical protein